MWELRDPQSLVSEELARWAGLDRATRLRRRYRPWQRRVGWADGMRLARARVEAALDETTGLFPQAFGGDPMVTDATSLLAAINGFFDRDDPRLKRLVRATIEALGEGDFMRRYPPADDGFIGREACFVPASWWAVSALAIIGELAEAVRRADGMCAQLHRCNLRSGMRSATRRSATRPCCGRTPRPRGRCTPCTPNGSATASARPGSACGA